MRNKKPTVQQSRLRPGPCPVPSPSSSYRALPPVPGNLQGTPVVEDVWGRGTTLGNETDRLAIATSGSGGNGFLCLAGAFLLGRLLKG